MTTSELKIKMFEQIDALDKTKFLELYGVFLNYVNGQKDIPDWNSLTVNQKKGILEAIDELDAGKGIPNNFVLDKFRKKYSNA
jgi:hypothetical protein